MPFRFSVSPQGVGSRIHRRVLYIAPLRLCPSSSFSSSLFAVTCTATPTNTTIIPPQQTMFGRRSPATHQEQVEGRKCTVNVNRFAFIWLRAVLYSLLALLPIYKHAEYLQSSLLKHLRCQQRHLNDIAQLAQIYIYFVLTK